MSHLRIFRGPLVVLLFAAPRAGACLNDRSIAPAEAEFRSRYESASGDVRVAPPNSINPWAVVAMAVGGGLIAGSSVAAVQRWARS